MENEKVKNNSGLIILLVLIILGLAGYIVYDKALSNKNLENQEQTVKDEIKEGSDLKENIDIFQDLVGTYSYSSDNTKITLTLNSNGKATYKKDATNSGGSIAEGTWSISKISDEERIIYINNELCQPYYLTENDDKKCDYPNCQPIYTLYQYNTDKDIIFDGQIELKK